MELTTKQVHEAIDKILPSFLNESNAKHLQLLGIKQIKSINPKIDNQVERVFRIMTDNNLIHSRTMDSYALTEFGKKILENGGWLKYCDELESEKQIEKETKRLTLDVLKKQFIQVKYWWLILLATALCSALFSWIFSLM